VFGEATLANRLRQQRVAPPKSTHHNNPPIQQKVLATHLIIAFVTTRALPKFNGPVEQFLEAYCKHGGTSFLLCGLDLRYGSQSLHASIQYTPRQ